MRGDARVIPSPPSPSGMATFIALRTRTLEATPGFVGRASAAPLLGQYWERGAALGHTHAVVADGRAQLYFFRDPDAWLGVPVVLGWVDRDPRDAAALGPLGDALDAHAERLDAHTLIEIRVDDAPLLAALEARGFGIDSVIQVGDPRRARAALEPASAPRAAAAEDPLAAAGLALAPLGPGDVDAVIALHAAVFGAEPAWCWFGASPRHLARMAADLRREPLGHFVVRAGRDVVGHVGAELQAHAFWGDVGGLELVLAPAHRGRGLARALYRAALDWLLARGARCIKGGTSQPGVLALGRTLERPWHSFNMRRDVAFAREHFLRFAPDAVLRAHAAPAPADAQGVSKAASTDA